MKSRFPRWLAGTALERYVLHLENAIQRAVTELASSLPDGSLVLDAGAGEARLAGHFARHRYIGVDLGVGDADWDYGSLDAVADLSLLPFASSTFDACLNIVTLEHLREPACALGEMGRVLRPGGVLLLVVPLEWEVHQAPHDYFRFTCYGARHLLEKTGFADIQIQPVGGFFRLLARLLLSGLRFFPVPLRYLVALFAAPPALVLPALDFLDRDRVFTLGYVCTARKPS